MTSTILTNSFRFPPPFSAPDIDWLGDDVGVTRGQSASIPEALNMPVNSFDPGDQIIVIVNYFWGADHTQATPPRCSDNISGTNLWNHIFNSGDSLSDMWMDMHVKVALGGETSIDYTLHSSTDMVAYVLRLGPDDHIELNNVGVAAAANPVTTLSDVGGVTTNADASTAWFFGASDDKDGATLSNPGAYVLAISEDDADISPDAALTIWEQSIPDAGGVTNTTDLSFTSSGRRHGRQIAMSRKANWSTPVIEGEQFTTGSLNSGSPISPSNPAGMQVGDVLLYFYIVSDDTATTPVWNGDTSAWWNQIVNIANNASQDWRITMGWRYWDGTEPTWSVVTSTGNTRSCEIIMYRISGCNPHQAIPQQFAYSPNNTIPISYNVPPIHCPPNSLAFFGVGAWGSITVTQPPTGLDSYTSPTSKLQLWTGVNSNQDVDPYGTIDYNAAFPPGGIFGFHIAGIGEQPAEGYFPLIENFISLDQEVLAWGSGEVWNNFHGWGWKPDGTKFVTGNNSNDRLYGFDFATPFDFNTTSNNSANPGQAVFVTPTDTFFNEDGTKYVTLSRYSTQQFTTYNAATPYEPKTTDTQIGQSLVGAYSSTSMESYWVDRSGTHAIFSTVANSPDKLIHFKMTTPWDASTIVLQSDEFQPGFSAGRIYMSPTGLDMFFGNPNNDSGIGHYRMSKPYDLSTMTLVSILATGGARGGSLWMTDDGTKLIDGPGANDPYNIQVRTIPPAPTIAPPQEENLTIWLDAGEEASYSGAGQVWYDLSGHRNHATWLRGVANCESIYTGGSAGYFDLDLSAVHNSRVFSIADDVSIRPDGTGNWTVSYLVAPSSVSAVTNDYLAFKGNTFAMLYGYYSAGRFSPFINASATWNDTFDTYIADEIDGWYLVTMRRNGAVIDGNINGNWNTDASNAAPTISSTVGSPWYIGGTNGSTATLFPGAVAGMWFWNGVALSDVEVAEHVTNISNRYTLEDTSITTEALSATGNSTWVVPDGVTSVDLLLVGGGAAGSNAGGSGAGGVLEVTSYAVTPGSTIYYTVGAGSTGNITNSQPPDGGRTKWDTNSSWSDASAVHTAFGGGAGGTTGGAAANSGGSGGGGGFGGGGGIVGAAGTVGQGNAGGNSRVGSGTVAQQRVGGGGGGAGAAGAHATGTFTVGPMLAGDGGDGIDMSANWGTTYGVNGWFGAGSGGGRNLLWAGELPVIVLEGAAGFGGAGELEQDAIDGTGSAGGPTDTAGVPGGKGGDGIILIKYEV